ncbi:MAG TPA: ribosome maturation factor RimP [Acidimicrobiales bacterium]|jgi:ribosome maturation factor RimP|nr:ribosome maturation factor RimP [Acidimicrobiales bacterium]
MTNERTDLADALSPVVEARGLELIDVELKGAQLTVFVDREGGVGLDELADATKDVSAELDRLDPLPGRYTLTVSSPGLERRLRTPAHFARAVGQKVTVRIDAGTADVRRLSGTLEAADDSGCTLTGPEVPDGELRISYDQIERARTVFDWGPAPRRTKNERVKRP